MFCVGEYRHKHVLQALPTTYETGILLYIVTMVTVVTVVTGPLLCSYQIVTINTKVRLELFLETGQFV